jgi:hypothetical protein
MVADVILDDGIAIDTLANLGENLVPGPADLLEQVALEGSEVLVEVFLPAAAALDALALGQTVEADPLGTAGDAFAAGGETRPEARPLDNHLGHVLAHDFSVSRLL